MLLHVVLAFVCLVALTDVATSVLDGGTGFINSIAGAIVWPFTGTCALIGAVLGGIWLVLLELGFMVFAVLRWVVAVLQWVVALPSGVIALIQTSTLALTALLLGLAVGVAAGFLVGFLAGGSWGWTFYTQQLHVACTALTRWLRPRIDAAMEAAVHDTGVTRRFVEILNVMPPPKTGIDFVRYFTGPLTMVRALQHPDAPVALAYAQGREQVALVETRLVVRVYLAQLEMAWATAWGNADRAKAIYDESVIWMRALHELILVRREARKLRDTMPPETYHRHADALAAPFLTLKEKSQ